MLEEYKFWELNYLSCEGNKRWTIVRTPYDFEEDDIINNITLGGIGDDYAEIISLEETCYNDYRLDLTL